MYFEGLETENKNIRILLYLYERLGVENDDKSTIIIYESM